VLEAGLVNGSVGTIVEFVKGQRLQKEEITHIAVKFDSMLEQVRIERESCTFEVLKGIFYSVITKL